MGLSNAAFEALANFVQVSEYLRHCGASYPERNESVEGMATLSKLNTSDKVIMSMRASTLFGGGECHAPISLGCPKCLSEQGGPWG